jgi:hypothetical protein
MSNKALHWVDLVVRSGVRACTSVLSLSAAVLLVSALSCMGQAPDPLTVLRASSELAEALPTDVVRLALMSSIVSQVCLMAFVFASQRTTRLLLQRPCMLSGQAGRGVMREALHDAAARKD